MVYTKSPMISVFELKYNLYTRVARNVMYTVAHHDNVLHDFVDDNPLE